MAREEDLGRYQMLWDCTACGTAGLLALDHKFCPVCGAPHDPKTRYFPSDEQKILVEDHPFHGADRICPACDTTNAGNASFCQSCGCPLDAAKAAATRADRVLDADQADSGESLKDARDAARQAHLADEARRKAAASGQAPPEPADGAPPKKSGRSWLLIGCGTFAVLALLGCVGFFLLSFLFQTSGQVTVTGHRWEREIPVEVYGAVTKEDWKTSVPLNARDVRCRDAVKDTRKVPDGEDCKVRKKDNGDGTFSEKKECTTRYRKEDVMAPKCKYTVDDWKVGRTERAQGSDLSPQWPSVRLAQGTEREGKRDETYTVELRGPDGTEHTCSVPEPRWRALTVGTTLDVSFGGLTGAIDCGDVR